MSPLALVINHYVTISITITSHIHKFDCQCSDQQTSSDSEHWQIKPEVLRSSNYQFFSQSSLQPHVNSHEFVVLSNGLWYLWFGDPHSLYEEPWGHGRQINLESLLQVLINLVCVCVCVCGVSDSSPLPSYSGCQHTK